MVRLAALAIATALLAACSSPSEEEIEAEFAEVVAQSNACKEASECAFATTVCPLGCRVAVNRDHKSAVEAKAIELVDAYNSNGASCNYLCAAPGALVCEAGRCAEGAVP